MPARLDVVIPAHDAAPFLRETVEALARQTRPADTVWIVDDRSTDGTRALAEALAGELAPRLPIRVLANAGPPGPSAARNTALRASVADVIALMDADDLAEPSHHACLLGLIEAAPDIVLGFGNSLVFSAEAGVLVPDMHAKSGLARQPAQEIAPGVLTLGEAMFAAMLGSGVFTTSAAAFRRDAALAAGLFDETLRYSEDTDLFLRLALAGRFAFTAAVLTRKRVHGANLVGHDTFHFCRGTALSLAGLAARGVPAPHRAALADGLRRALFGHLYASSRRGPRAYAEAARLAARTGHGAMALAPKHLARVLLSLARRQPGRPPP